MMTVPEAAKHMGVSAELIRRWCREKKIPGAIQTGIKRPEWIIPEKGVEEAMKNIQVKQRPARKPLVAPDYKFRVRAEGEPLSPEEQAANDFANRVFREEVDRHFAAGRPVIGSRNGVPKLVWPDGRMEDITDENWEAASAIWRAKPAYDPPWPKSDDNEGEMEE